MTTTNETTTVAGDVAANGRVPNKPYYGDVSYRGVSTVEPIGKTSEGYPIYEQHGPFTRPFAVQPNGTGAYTIYH